MIEQTYPASSQEPISEPDPQQLVTAGNLAAARCMHVYEETFKAEMAKGTQTFHARENAARHYRSAMPTPSGRDGIRNFVACVAQGVLIGAISAQESKALLYAAQVAQHALREPAPPNPKRY